MRILFIDTIQMFGGGEVWMLRTLQGLRKRGHHVALLCRPHTEVGKRAEDKDIPVFRMQVGGDFGPITILRTIRLLRREKFDILLTNMDKELRFAGLAARIVGRIIVIPRRGIDYPLKNKMRYRFAYNKLADALIANSEATKTALLRNAPWLNAKRIHVVYNGIDPKPFMDGAEINLRKEWGLGDDALIIGFAGQLDERKGIDCLLQAFARTAAIYENVHLVLAGQGPLASRIEKFAGENHLAKKIHLPGFLDKIENFMKSIDIFVLPSLWEGFGIVLIEAMAAGKPAITTDVSSMPEIVLDGKTGKIIKVNDVDALSQAMNDLLKDNKLRKLLGQEGQRRVLEKFSIDRMLDSLENLFRELMAVSKGAKR